LKVYLRLCWCQGEYTAFQTTGVFLTTVTQVYCRILIGFVQLEKVALLQLQRVDDEGDEDGVEVDNWGICKKIGVCLSGIHDQ
jgi:hypothetical protein